MNKALVSILVCEDDVNYGMLLCEFLQTRGYKVDFAQDGEQGWQYFNQKTYDLCIFDISMPHKDGFTLTREIRATGADTPIIFLSARTSQDDMLEGYRAGADDYITKPCLMEIVIYKIENIIRRIRKIEEEEKTQFQLGNLFFDATHQTLTDGINVIHLSSHEAELLQVLAQNANHLVERSYILKRIWSNDNYFSTRSLSVYINHVRNHLKLDSSVKIMSVHGKGYKLILP